MENTKLNSKPLYAISIAAELLEVHQRTLRIYDEKGLLCPKRTEKNRRLYSQNDIEKAKLILYLTRNLAMNLSGVKTILRILNKFNVKENEYMPLIKETSVENNVDEDENILKNKRRGRKPKAEQE